MNTKPLPRLNILPTRLQTTTTLLLPRLMLVGALLAFLGIAVGFQHTPGHITALDLLACTLFVTGMGLFGWGVRPSADSERSGS